MKESSSVRLKKALDLRNLKQVDIVEKTGISKSLLSMYINGKAEPRQNNIHKLAKLLNVNEAWLMGYDVPMEKDNGLNFEHEAKIENSNARADIIFPDGKAFDFKVKNGKVFIHEYNIHDNPIQFKEYELTPEEQKDYNKILGMNMFFFEGDREVDTEDKLNLEKTLLTIFIKNYFKKHSN